MLNQKSKIGILALFLIFLCGFGCQQKNSKPQFDISEMRDYANALYNKQLFQQAVQKYNLILQDYDLDDSEAANINYIIGNIFFERIRDYENALSYYLKIRHLYKDSNLMNEVNKKMVACLERLERSADAQQVLDEAVMLDPSQARQQRPGDVVAKIGRRRITTGDLEFEINQLPPYMKTQLTERSKKIDFLKQYIATELLYDSAKREGLDRDKDVIEATFQAKKNIMVQNYLADVISKDVNVDDSDVRLYYDAHKEKYAEKDEEGKVVGTKPFEEVKTRVMQDVIREKQQEIYESRIQKLMRDMNVELFEHKLK